jgi:predicted HAD superfamily phosphohydrolase YqeG
MDCADVWPKAPFLRTAICRCNCDNSQRRKLIMGPRLRGIPLEFLDVPEINGSTIIVDIDGTMTADRRTEVAEGALAALRGLASRNAVYLFSNHGDSARNRAIARRSGLDCIETPHRKPSRKVFEAIPAQYRARPLIVIGDKVMIDGVFARRIGGRFIKVDRVVSPSDRKSVRLAYFIDDLIARLVGWKAWQSDVARR